MPGYLPGFFIEREEDGMIYESLEQLIGHTPLLKLNRLKESIGYQADIYAKLECFNPAGSAKDRAALTMILEAEKQGLLKEGSVIIEPTSGNTGIGLASIARVRGYRTIIVMPDSMSMERRSLIAAYGAELVLTDGAYGMAKAIEKANELAKEIPDAFIPAQFDNVMNAKAHYISTGPEIFQDMQGEIDYFVAGIGTGGTITGTGHYLKERNPDIKIIGVEPSSSAVLSGEPSGKHGIEGIGAGFIPGVLDTKVYDNVVRVSEAQAYESAELFMEKEGVLVGISSGAALHASIEIAKKESAGKKIVVLLPDTGTRYLSTPLFQKEK